MRKILVVLITMAISLGSVNIMSFLWIRDNGGALRYEIVESLETDVPESLTRPATASEFAQRFCDGEPEEVLIEVMNSVQRVGQGSTNDPVEVLQHAEVGGGLTCAGMACLYAAALEMDEVPVRIVAMRRTFLNSFDSYTTVEVLTEDGWTIYDPTFAVSFELDGELLGAQEVHDALIDGNIKDVRVVYWGEALFPARLESYYMDWKPIFNHVRIFASGESLGGLRGKLAKLPVFRYWIGSRYYLQEDPGHMGSFIRLHNGLYFATIVVLPLIVISLTLAALAVVLIGRHRVSKSGAATSDA